eukprot:CAMPEP_0172412818 /NCGR_PEP_ID=MMETSP1061-20121228/78101_1 /TAXON_ID=37318 /ORGANISM="Pseudo-nitzschia pungens, Strain cf. pungens" /LENGTH=708 /DNA_ID=CAMNT_0013149065 /DNA_START=62 /DNA_END=2188 /DNA_ORIENTATION=-
MTEIITKQHEIKPFSSSISIDFPRQPRRRSFGSNNRSIGKMSASKQYESISLKEVLGGEKNCTNSFRIRSDDDDDHSCSSRTWNSKASAVDNAEAKIQNILRARKTKDRRRQNVSKSLESAVFLDSRDAKLEKETHVSQESSREQQLNEEKEGELSLNDGSSSKREGRRPQRHYRNDSPSRLKRRSITRDQRRAMVRSASPGSLRTKRNESSDDLVGLDSTIMPRDHRRTRVRSRSPGSLRTKLELQRQRSRDRDDSYDTNSKKASITRKVKSKAAMDDDGDEKGEAPKRRSSRSRSSRSRSQNRYRSKSVSSDDGSLDPKSHVRSNRSLSREPDLIRDRSRGPKSRRSRSKPRLSSHLNDENEDDNKSTSSQNTSRRARTYPRESRPGSNEDPSSDDNGSTSSAPSTMSQRCRHPLTSRRNSRKRLTKRRTHSSSSIDIAEGNCTSPETTTERLDKFSKRSSPSLGDHFQHSPSASDKEETERLSMVEERSTTSSLLSCSNAQPILLQFDPTKDTFVQAVDQTTAKKTHDIIHQSNGTESKIEISELSGLPTFEKPCSTNDFNESSMNNTLSTRSMYSSDGGSVLDSENRNKSFTVVSPGSDASVSYKSMLGESRKLEESVLESNNERLNDDRLPLPPSRNRGVLGNNLQAKKSAFLQKVQETKDDVKSRLMKNPTINRAGIRLGRTVHQVLDDNDDDSIADHESLS